MAKKYHLDYVIFFCLINQNCTVVWHRKQKDMSLTTPIVEKPKEGSQTGELEAACCFINETLTVSTNTFLFKLMWLAPFHVLHHSENGQNGRKCTIHFKLEVEPKSEGSGFLQQLTLRLKLYTCAMQHGNRVFKKKTHCSIKGWFLCTN